MGTNYYIRYDKCIECGERKEDYHIGKSSAGWCFSLHVEPEKGINDLNNVMCICEDTSLLKRRIIDEYDDVISLERMQEIIAQRSWKNTIPRAKKMLEQNYAVEGPNGLLRHKIDKVHCIGHGKGTWDLIAGEFS